MSKDNEYYINEAKYLNILIKDDPDFKHVKQHYFTPEYLLMITLRSAIFDTQIRNYIETRPGSKGRAPKGQLVHNAWARELNIKFKSWDDFFKETIKTISISDLLAIPPAFFYELPKITTFDQFIKIIRQRIEREKPYSVAIFQHFTGKPEYIKPGEIKDPKTYGVQSITDFIYKNGTLRITFPKDGTPNRITPFIHKLVDYCIVNMADDGSIPVLTNPTQIYKDFGVKKGGKQSKKINDTINLLCHTEADLGLEIMPLEVDGKVKLVTPDPDKILKPYYLQFDKGGKEVTSKKPVRYLAASFLISLKKNRLYLIYRDKKYFKLPDDEYRILIYLHGQFRLNLKKGIFSRNLLSICSDIDYNFTKNIIRELSKLHEYFINLQSQKVFETFYVTNKKTRDELSKTWYKEKIYTLTKTVDSKTYPQKKILENIIYNFIPTKEFVNEHILGQKKTAQTELAL